MRVLAFGDSITQGFMDSKGGWVNRIREYYDRRIIDEDDFGLPTVFNLGISGETTAGLLKRLEPEIVARQFEDESYIFVFAAGTNDTIYRKSGNECEPTTYVQELAEIVSIAKKYGNKLLFVGLLPVVDELLQPVPWSASGKYYSTERMKTFNEALVSFCADNDLPCVDVWSVFEGQAGLRQVMFDGLHPNDKGHQLIAETVRPELEKLL